MAQRSGKKPIIISCGLLIGLSVVFMIGGGACTKKSDSEKAGREARETYEKSKEYLKEGLDKTKDLTKEGLQKSQEAAKDFSKGWKEGGK